jgi:hypothetical protein
VSRRPPFQARNVPQLDQLFPYYRSGRSAAFRIALRRCHDWEQFVEIPVGCRHSCFLDADADVLQWSTASGLGCVGALAIRLAKGSHAGSGRAGEPCLSPLRNRSQRKLDFAALHGVDWIAHNALPVVADAILICGGAGLIAEKPFAPYAIAGASTLLLISGIYGAWDLTLWMVTNRDKT